MDGQHPDVAQTGKLTKFTYGILHKKMDGGVKDFVFRASSKLLQRQAQPAWQSVKLPSESRRQLMGERGLNLSRADAGIAWCVVHLQATCLSMDVIPGLSHHFWTSRAKKPIRSNDQLVESGAHTVCTKVYVACPFEFGQGDGSAANISSRIVRNSRILGSQRQ